MFCDNAEGFARMCLISIVFFKEVFNTRSQVYKKRSLEVLEVSCYLNLMLLCFATLFALESDTTRESLAYASVSIMFVQFLAVVCYYVFIEVLAKTSAYIKLAKTSAYIFIKNHIKRLLCLNRECGEEDDIDLTELTELHVRTSSMSQRSNTIMYELSQSESDLSKDVPYTKWEQRSHAI